MFAALLYFAATFAAGFVLGTVRTLFVAPALGETAAVLIEVPLMVLVAWLACGWAIRRSRVSAAFPDRLVMGALAFALLMVAEALLGILLFGRTLPEHLATYSSLPAQVGLAAQFAFAAFPLLRR